MWLGAVSIALFVGSAGLIVYHYIGYPLAVLGLSRLRRPRPPAPVWRPSVSLIIPAYNEAAVLPAKVENALALDWPDLEIIVVADGSTDGTVDLLARYADQGVKVLFEPARRGKPAAMNRGVAAARGEIIVFSDANAFLAPSAIRALVAGFDSPKVAIVSGRKTVQSRADDGADTGFARSEGGYWSYEDRIRRAEDRLGTTVATVGEIFAIRRALYRAQPDWVVNDDAYLTMALLRQGYDVRYAPDAVSWEHGSHDTGDERTRRRRIAAGRWLLLSAVSLWPVNRPWAFLALVSHKWLRLALPFLFVVAYLANLAAMLSRPDEPLLSALFLLQTVFYTAALIGRWSGDWQGALGKGLRLCHFVTASNLSSALGFWDWATGRASPTWTKVER